MADLKITQLPSYTTPLGTDILPIVKDPSGTPLTDKILLSDLGLITSWNPIQTTLSYSSADGHTFVITTNSIDLTGIIGVGDRIKFTNNATTFYGIVTAISTTSITIYGGTQYSVANSAITAPFYSHAKSPIGFPIRPDYWTEQVTDSTIRSQGTPTNVTWYNLGTISIDIPIGAWRVNYQVCVQAEKTTATSSLPKVTLSTANNSESDVDFTCYAVLSAGSATLDIGQTVFRQKDLILAAKTTYYLNTEATNNETTIWNRNDQSKLIINAICAYL